MIKPLIPPEDPLLHKRIKKCSYNLDRLELSKILNENMFHYDGVGLSANQIGINERAFIMMIDLETKKTITCFNPKIIKESKIEEIMQEGCLSYPGITMELSRSKNIIVKYEDEEKNIFKRRLVEFSARVFQHEYDHMEGIDFTERTK
jgi:peptide deformylase